MALTIDSVNNTILGLSAQASGACPLDGSSQVPDAQISQSSVTQHQAALSLTESQISDLTHTDADAIHDNVSGEIAAIAEKTSIVANDLVLIEDSAATNSKKRVTVSNLLNGGGGVFTADGSFAAYRGTLVDAGDGSAVGAFAMGSNATSVGNNCFAMGLNATSTLNVGGGASFSLGKNCIAGTTIGINPWTSVAIGYGITSTGGVAIGNYNISKYGVSIGNYNYAHYNSVAIGYNVTSKGAVTYSMALGIDCYSTNFSFALGWNCSAMGYYSMATGTAATSSLKNERTHGVDSTRQIKEYLLYQTTINELTDELLANGLNERIVLETNDCCLFYAYIIGRRTSTGDSGYAAKLEGLIERNATAGTTALIGSVTKTILSDGLSLGTNAVSASAEPTTGSLIFEVTGAASTTINWFAHVRIVKVNG